MSFFDVFKLQKLISRKDVSGRRIVWKFKYFCVTQIFREIKFDKAFVSKMSILNNLEALISDFEKNLAISNGINKLSS